jgi:exodeoxyribonuclease VII small subunit
MSGSASSNAPRSVESMTFEELVDELTDVTAQMDDGAIGIERAADLYDRASALHAAASARLVNVEARLEQLRGGRT